jgi:hypothetical protein
VRAALDDDDGPARVFGQTGGEHRTGGPAAEDENVRARGHAPRREVDRRDWRRVDSRCVVDIGTYLPQLSSPGENIQVARSTDQALTHL